MAGGGGEGELNLVPYLDIMLNLIMFLLVVTAYIVELKEAPVLVPTLTGDPGLSPTDVEKKGFLTVTVSPRALSVICSLESVPPSELLRKGKTLPYSDLTRVLRQYKESQTLEDALQIVADPSTPYSEVVATMDAARSDAKGDLFPGIQLALAASQ
jgi:biopolymer transport protein TolR